ncbi:hypothetical protein [Xenorhabdus bharatensis]|uniref:hypothetical protein n=1 Tax=Xenorhabdus bharatensis TaxID=3136256 RepID=UPI0030F49A13
MLVKKNKSTLLKIELSVPNGADIAVKQDIILDVNVSSRDKLPTDFSIKLDNIKGFVENERYHGSPTFGLNGDSFSQSFYLHLDDSIISGDSVSYTLVSSIDSEEDIVYHVKDLDLNIQDILTVDKVFIESPMGENNPFDQGSKYIRYTQKLRSKDGKLLKNTPMLVVPRIPNHLENFIYTTDPSHDGLPLKVLDIKALENFKVILVSSDDSGNIYIRAYPKKNVVLIFALDLLYANAAYQGWSTYIIPPYPKNSDGLLPVPIIPGLVNKKLHKGDGEKFKVGISHYTGAEFDDGVVFFISLKNDMPVSDSMVSDGIIYSNRLPHYAYDIYYDKIPIGKEITLYYFIIKNDNSHVMYSKPLVFEYVG